MVVIKKKNLTTISSGRCGLFLGDTGHSDDILWSYLNIRPWVLHRLIRSLHGQEIQYWDSFLSMCLQTRLKMRLQTHQPELIIENQIKLGMGLTDNGTNQFLVKFWPIEEKEHFCCSKIDRNRALLINFLCFL